MHMIEENVDLSKFTTIGTGGVAKYFVKCSTLDQLKEALSFARREKLKLCIIGGGSNVLVHDSGFNGILVQMAIEGLSLMDNGLVTVGAGVHWDRFVKQMIVNGLGGVEALSGIPGTVGATPIQNVGAYGQEVSDTIVQVAAIHRESFEERHFSREQCEFKYRDSFFKQNDLNPWIITSVQFKLSLGEVLMPQYKELEDRLQQDIHWQSSDRILKLNAIRDVVLGLRRAKGMVIDSADSDTRSVGSFFINPVVSSDQKNKMLQIAIDRKINRTPVFYEVGSDTWKISAAWLIEASGFSRGQLFGSVGISSKHVLALTNVGHATTQEILDVAAIIRQKVRSIFGIELRREPVIVGP